MERIACFAAIAVLLAGADIPQVSHLRPPATLPVQFPPGQSLPVLPELAKAGEQDTREKKDSRADRLQPASRLELVRYVSGEFARAVRPLPGGKKGFRTKAGERVDEVALRQAVASRGSVANPGDTVQVTRLEFREREIIIDINGGGKQRTRWRDRIQVSVGGMPQVASSGGPPGFQGSGATLILDYGRPLPDLTPEDLKQHLAAFLDFSKQRSAATNWVETLPPEFQQAIKDRRALVGMDREMVIAAIGRPDHKVRERDSDGLETEDWIYGHPPAKTVFVKFAGNHVIGIQQYP